MRILIIDDDEDIRELLAIILRSQRHEVETAADGREALERLRGGYRPSLILLDLMMPRLDGEGLLREMRRDLRLRDMPVCIISGHQATREKAEQLGTVGCLVKPIELAELHAVIQSVAADELETRT